MLSAFDSALESHADLDKIDRELQTQNKNPVKVLTSSEERMTETPFEAGGKMGYVERVPWWTDYSAEPFCVFGHYAQLSDQREYCSHAYCIDYAVTKRWEERLDKPDFEGPYKGMLVALRWNEKGKKEIVFDNGELRPLADLC